MTSDARADTPNANPIDFIARPTPRLRAAVEHQRSAMSAADFPEVIATIRSVFDKFTARLQSAPAGAARGRVLHLLTEQTQAPAAQVKVTCAKGCCSCCHYEIEVTRDEAAILADLVRAGFPIDAVRLRVQAARERKAPEWLQVLMPDNRCVFLGADGACQIYEHRPSSCRRHLVTSPAAACADLGLTVAPVELLMTEILLSAALSIEGVQFASMSKMLTAELGL